MCGTHDKLNPKCSGAHPSFALLDDLMPAKKKIHKLKLLWLKIITYCSQTVQY